MFTRTTFALLLVAFALAVSGSGRAIEAQAPKPAAPGTLRLSRARRRSPLPDEVETLAEITPRFVEGESLALREARDAVISTLRESLAKDPEV